MKTLSRNSALLALSLVLAACRPAPREPVVPAPVVPPPPASEPEARENLESRLRRTPKLASIMSEAAQRRFQVVVGVVSPDGKGWSTRDGFRADAEYIYPASAIKLFSAVAALEALTEMREDGGADVDVDAGVVIDPSRRRRGPIATVGQLVNGALVMSDNDANNALFDIVGLDGIHARMWRMGLSTFRMRHRLGVGGGDDIRVSPRVDLLGGARPVVIAPREGRVDLGKNTEPGVLVGDSYFVGGRLVEEPMSFEDKNRVSLADLQRLLVAVTRPELSEETLRLGTRERAVLVDALTTLPSAKGASVTIDHEHKPFLAGLERVVPRESLTVVSKSGRAYGFLVENAYVVDRRSDRAFFLAAAMYSNPNGRLNDDNYDYRPVAFPTFANLAESVARLGFEDG